MSLLDWTGRQLRAASQGRSRPSSRRFWSDWKSSATAGSRRCGNSVAGSRQPSADPMRWRPSLHAGARPGSKAATPPPWPFDSRPLDRRASPTDAWPARIARRQRRTLPCAGCRETLRALRVSRPQCARAGCTRREARRSGSRMPMIAGPARSAIAVANHMPNELIRVGWQCGRRFGLSASAPRQLAVCVRGPPPRFVGSAPRKWVSVRREKAWFFSRCNSHPAKVAPAGSYRSRGGGNKTVEAFETSTPLGGVASKQAVMSCERC